MASRRTSRCGRKRGSSCWRQSLRRDCCAENELLRLERKIDEDVRGSLFQNQREFYLQEQLKAIHRELGEDDGADNSELEAQIQKRVMPEVVKSRALRETRRLRRMSPLSPEAGVIRG